MKKLTLLSVVSIGLIILGLMFSSPGYTIDKSSIVLTWLFEEGSGTTVKDSSGNGNNGELVGGPQWAAGQFGGGLILDGADDRVVSKTATGVKPTFMSETLWVKFNGFDTEQQFGYISCSGTANARYFYFSTWSADGVPHNRIHLGTIDTAGNWGRGIATGKMFDTGQWYHVAGVINNETGIIRAYVDGTLAHEQNFDPGDPPGTPMEIWVGSSPEGYTWINGVVDEVAFFNVALTEDDIKSIMNGLGIETAVDPLRKLTTTWGGIKNAK
jgi:hypothetical protein